MKINNREISRNTRPYLIAEMSGNHNKSLDRAINIVEAAAASGADAIKLQTYKAETMTLNVRKQGFVIDDEASLWNGRQLYELYEEAHTPWEWHEPIMQRSKELGLDCFSTPFDDSSVEFLQSLGVPAYKIASFEIIDLPLIRKVATSGKPVIISTGMASVAEIDEAIRAAQLAGCNDLVILKCTSTYPASSENSNIVTIPNMRDTFQCEVGISDHTMGCGVSVASVALGAVIIEKHFTLCRADGGVDSAFSLEPDEFRLLRKETEQAWLSMGRVTYAGSPSEEKSRNFRRSLYIACDIKLGECLNENNLRIVRPGFGLPPKYYDMMLGKRVNRDISAGTPLSWDFIA